VKQVAIDLKALIMGIADWVKQNRELVATLVKVVVVVGAVVALLIGFGTSISLLSFALGALATAVGVIGTVLSALAAVIGALIDEVQLTRSLENRSQKRLKSPFLACASVHSREWSNEALFSVSGWRAVEKLAKCQDCEQLRLREFLGRIAMRIVRQSPLSH